MRNRFPFDTLLDVKTKYPTKIISKLEKKIHHRFKKKAWAYEALCHKSFVYDGPKNELKDNERLEFLGDSILGMIITEELFKKLEDFQEGELSVIKSTLIRRETLATLSKSLKLGDLLFLSKGEEASGGRERDSILANALEALIGAVYLDSGIRAVKKFILSQFKDFLDKVPHEIHTQEYKNLLQELAHVRFKFNPIYSIVSEQGPDHSKIFEATVSIHGEVYGQGSGTSKKEAEKNAAQAAYVKLTQQKFQDPSAKQKS